MAAEHTQPDGVKVLAGFAGFGSFMQDKSVQTLVTESEADYSPPALPVSSDPADHGMVVSDFQCQVLADLAPE